MKSLYESIFSDMNIDRTGYGYPTRTVDKQTSPPINTNVGPLPQQTKPFQTIDQNERIEIDHCSNMYDWQREIVDKLQTNNDIYILSGAGSGKTTPIICYWVNKILGISTTGATNYTNFINILTHPEKIPQVLWMVPIKNLGSNIEQETIERFTSIILQIFNQTLTAIRTPNPLEPNKILYIFNQQNLPIKTIIEQMGALSGFNIYRLTHIMHENSDGSITVRGDDFSDFKNIMGDLIREYVKNALVGRIEGGIYSVEIKRLNVTKPFIVSIYESASVVIKSLDRLKLIVFDEAQRLQGGTPADDERAAQIGSSVHTVLCNKNAKQSKILMLSGSVNPRTAQNVMQFFNIVYDRKFEVSPYQTPPSVKNPADIRVFPMANLDDFQTQLRIVQTALAGKHLRTSGIVYIIFSKTRINALIDKLAPREIGYISPSQRMNVSRDSVFSTKTDSKTISSPGDIMNISDERLRRAASHGLGYLYRPEELTPSRLKDTTIIQSLFRDGQVRVLFATDAVREGINITCDVIYIPSILLPPSPKTEMPLDSLTQLINRVGREKNKYATVYTDPKYVGTIVKALSGDPNMYDEQPFTFPDSTMAILKIGMKASTYIPKQIAISYYRAFEKAFRGYIRRHLDY